MRILLAVLLTAAVSAGDAADPLAERIAAGFAAWVSGDGKAACAVWTEGGLPAAGAEADVVAAQLDAVPAALRKADVKGPTNSTILANGSTSTSTVYLATVEAGERSVVIAFAFSGTPPKLASLASASGPLTKLLQEKVKMRLRSGLGGGRTFNPGHRTELTQQPKLADDALGPYVITGPTGVKIGKLVLWGPALGKPVEIPVDAELSLVSLSFTDGEKPTITCSWTPAAGEAGHRELPLLGAVPDIRNRSTRSTSASSLEQFKANPPIGQTLEQAARGRDPLPKAWSAWFELSWGEPPGGLSDDQAMTAPLPQAIVLTLE
jgi:hypothetical protein